MFGKSILMAAMTKIDDEKVEDKLEKMNYREEREKLLRKHILRVSAELPGLNKQTSNIPNRIFTPIDLFKYFQANKQ